MRVNYLTIFPEIFPSLLETSILGKASEKGLVKYNLIDIRDYAADKHRMVDDKAFGGEAGMVLMIEPLDNALNSIVEKSSKNSAIILTDAAGTTFNQQIAGELAEKEELTFICGRYKGVDERIKSLYNIKPLSIGDYVINGGEIPSLVITEAVVRLIPGVLGNIESAEEDSHFDGLLSSPVYTRPAEYREIKVPEVLLSGNHARISEWRYKAALERTERIRPDLYNRYKSENSR